MKITEAARMIGISASKLYHLVAAKQIAHYRVGGTILFSDDDIASFLAGCRVAPSPTANISQPPRLKLKHINLSRGS